MRITGVLGYLFSAFLYVRAWWNPAHGPGEGLVEWVSFEKLCLAEFLTCHATTLLGGFAMAAEMETPGENENFRLAFWILAGGYLLLGTLAYGFHRDLQAMVGFYLLLAIRASQFLSLRNPNEDMMRAQVVKNFAMFVPMMLLVAAIAMSDGDTPWQARFMRSHSTLGHKIANGFPLLVVTAYYVLWAVVEWKWPVSMHG